VQKDANYGMSKFEKKTRAISDHDHCHDSKKEERPTLKWFGRIQISLTK